MSERIGFIGLGTMGGPQARNLARSGRAVVVYDAAPAAVEALAGEANVTVATSAREVTAQCDVVCSCLPDDAAVDAAYRGPEGVLAAARDGMLTCDMSTVSPGFTAGLAEELSAKGVTHFTAPMLGSKPQAERGEIFFIVGGPADALSRLAPVLEVAGRAHIHVGDAQQANQVKLLHNALGAVNYAAVGESVLLAAGCGVDLDIYHKVVCNGGGMAYGNYFERKVPTIAAGDYSPRFKLKLAHKDAGLAREAFGRLDVPTPIHQHARELLQAAMEAGFGEEDASAVTKVLEQRNGRTVQGKK